MPMLLLSPNYAQYWHCWMLVCMQATGTVGEATSQGPLHHCRASWRGAVNPAAYRDASGATRGTPAPHPWPAGSRQEAWSKEGWLAGLLQVCSKPFTVSRAGFVFATLSPCTVKVEIIAVQSLSSCHYEDSACNWYQPPVYRLSWSKTFIIDSSLPRRMLLYSLQLCHTPSKFLPTDYPQSSFCLVHHYMLITEYGQ